MISTAAVLKGVGKLLGGATRVSASRRFDSSHGAFFRDVETAFPDYRFATIFDVGANVGEVAGFFLECAPQAQVHAFEPAPEAFAELAERLQGRAVANDCALGSADGAIAFRAKGVSSSNRPVSKRRQLARGHVIEVALRTGDGYCTERGIDRISLLKSDTEGFELEVLSGFASMLGRQAIDFIDVEAGMHPGNRKHVPFETLKGRLEGDGYRLFRLYEQRADKPAPILRRVNAVFVSLAFASGGGS